MKHNALPTAPQDLKIDVKARRVWKGALTLRLTRLEYEVLEYLAQRAGQLVTYQELWREVWQYSCLLGKVEQRAVRQAIKRIRHKLGDNWRTPRYLECVYGLGYRCATNQVTLVE